MNSQEKDVEYTIDIEALMKNESLLSELKNVEAHGLRFHKTYNLKSNGREAKIFNEHILFLFMPSFIPFRETESNKEILLNGPQYIQSYIDGFEKGAEHFKNRFEKPLLENSADKESKEVYVSQIHEHYCHTSIRTKHPFNLKGWRSIKKYPLFYKSNISHSIIREFGYYSGIVDAAESFEIENPKLFQKFMICVHEKREEDKANQEDTTTLAELFEKISDYQKVMGILVEKNYCDPVTFIWKDAGNGNKNFLAALIKVLHTKGYYKEPKPPTINQIRAVAKNTFHWKISIDTIKKAKPDSFDFTFIPYCST